MEKNMNEFTFRNIRKYFETALSRNYSIITCREYAKKKELEINGKIIINRIDVDLSVKGSEKLGIIFNNLNIKGTFFIRLHAPEYNPFSFENYRIIKFLVDSGHEIGYHSEIIDQSAIWNENIEDNLRRDIDVINRMFDIKIQGVASHHSGRTGLNNLDFWEEQDAKDFGLLYEAYDWFNETFYVSDSEWTQWKCYDKGKLIKGDRKSLEGHVKDDHPIIYLLIHSDTFYEKHFYE